MKILLAGDSTVANCPTHEYPMNGWGAHLAAEVYSWAAVYNYAKGGASTESFREEGLWAALLAEAGKGDLVLIQFGHNDQKRPHLAARTGYAANLRTMLAEVRSLDASLSSAPRLSGGTSLAEAETSSTLKRASRTTRKWCGSWLRNSRYP